MDSPKLYLVHCGFYDELTSGGGVFEGHTNLMIVSDTPQNARAAAKASDLYKAKRMHIDGIQEIVAVDGYRVDLVPDAAFTRVTEIHAHNFRDLAPTRTTA